MTFYDISMAWYHGASLLLTHTHQVSTVQDKTDFVAPITMHVICHVQKAVSKTSYIKFCHQEQLLDYVKNN